MIQPCERLDELERRYSRERWKGATFEEALAVFEGLWTEASALREDFPGDWREDIEPDLTLARVLNGLPATP